ncbi:MAG TPA: tetratricopeptide repeat protein [Sphingomicrobium sp.]|jgi:Flp pilus assembly protein TadD|nr:tetratricopeptide repeat protein [Sphingomicrobium sp.]
MMKPHRFGSAASAFVLSTMLLGCAAPQEKTGFGGRTGDNVGLATRALMALNSNDTATAIDFAERAVEKTPDDAGFRAILGNAYFKAGRFESAEAAYKDSLTIYSNQPQVILKLALVETALGKKDEAVAFLQAGRQVLDPSNYGLALALAGRPSDAIPVLEAAARQPGADATVRQNLALAHGLAGDWTEARTIAAQDVTADKLDGRMQQWMLLASPKKPSDQVAALVGVTPSPTDRGEPVRLALRKSDTMVAQSAPAKPAPRAAVAQAPAAPAPKFVQAVAAPAMAPQAIPAVAPAPSLPTAEVRPVIAEAPLPTPVAMIAAAAREVSTAAATEVSAVVKSFMPKKAPTVRPAKPHRAAPRPVGPGDAVMQIASYRSPQQVNAGWNHLTQRYPALRAYLPLRARFDSPNGTYWRLSIQGFSNQREAIARCQELKNRGGKCFVRSFAGDKPVEIASN